MWEEKMITMLELRLKELRKKKGVSQKNVADAICCSVDCYSKYERNKREPNIDSLKLLSKYFGVSIDYLVCND